jgi:hypothetical protein
MKSEHTALEELVKQWSEFSTTDRAQCINPNVYSPSYVEWITCLEVQRDVRRLAKHI